MDAIVKKSQQQRAKPLPALSDRYIKRFWSKVDKSGGVNACWPWIPETNIRGYCRTKIGHVDKYMAHRIALAIHSGEDKPHLLALHSCDNRRCCNPHHLRWGTHQENSDDLVNRRPDVTKYKVNQFSKIGLGRAKLNPSQIDYIVRLLDADYTVTQCAKWYCVTPSLVHLLYKQIKISRESFEAGYKQGFSDALNQSQAA